MNDNTTESLSVFLDDELDANQLDKLAQVLEYQAPRQQIARFELIGQAIRSESIHLNTLDVANAVRTQIAQEPTILAPRKKHRLPANVWIPATAAMAAGVAALSVWLGGTPLPTEKPQLGSPSFAQQIEPINLQTQKVSHRTRLSEADRKELERLLTDHSVMSGRGGMPQFVPYATLVSYDSP